MFYTLLMNNQSIQWSSKNAFILVAIGATLSMKDFLTFPVIAMQNGGGAFLLLYTFFLFILSLPLILSELIIGRFTHTKNFAPLSTLTQHKIGPQHWQWLFTFSLIACFLLVSIYSVFAGWSLSLIFKTAVGIFDGVNSSSVNTIFHDFQQDPERMMFWHTLFVIIMLSISSQGLKLGVEKALKFILPLMTLLLIVGLSYALVYGDYVGSIKQLLLADFSQLDIHAVVLAMKRAFYTVAVGLGIFYVFGAKITEDMPIVYSAGVIIVVDLLFSIFTGLAINSLILSVGSISSIQDDIAFTLLPLIFSNLPMGDVFGSLFYILLTLAALTTAIALLEVLLQFLKNTFNISRIRATAYAAVFVWALGVVAILSYSVWFKSGFTLELYLAGEAYRLVNEASFQDVLIYLASHVLQPLIALLSVVFVAWVLKTDVLQQQLQMGNTKRWYVIQYLFRYIAPTLVVVVWLSSLGVINA